MIGNKVCGTLLSFTVYLLKGVYVFIYNLNKWINKLESYKWYVGKQGNFEAECKLHFKIRWSEWAWLRKWPLNKKWRKCEGQLRSKKISSQDNSQCEGPEAEACLSFDI